MQLPGTPSDEVDDVLATGRGDITTLFVSMATRHPDGTDAEYLRWHTLDHRPEQHRLSAVRASLRLVSTPACRAARAAGTDRYDAIDHVMTYFFSDPSGMDGFLALAKALIGGKRKLPLLPPVERGVYDVKSKSAAPRVKVGADVLPWWPVKGVYLLLERGDATGRCVARRRRRGGRLVGGDVGRRREAGERARPANPSRTASSTTTRSPRRSGCRRC